MDLLVPKLTPLDGADGVSIGTEVRVSYLCEIEPGIINSQNFFMVVKADAAPFEYSKAISSIIEANVSEERDPLSDDHGYPATIGQCYRSTIVIKPIAPLAANTNFSVVLGGEIVQRNVFSPVKDVFNKGTGNIFTKGPYKGKVGDLYTVTINAPGDKTDAHYTWKRESDGLKGPLTRAQSSFYEIIDGIFIRFGDGTFLTGDFFVFRVVPVLQYSEILVSSFSTALSDYKSPEQPSVTLTGVPGNATPEVFVTNPELQIISITPHYAASDLPLPMTGTLLLGQVVYSTKVKTGEFNGTQIEYKELPSSVPSEFISVVNKDIFIFVKPITTSRKVVDLFNDYSSRGVEYLGALTSYVMPEFEDEIVVVESKGRITNGVNRINIVIEFNEEIKKEQNIQDKIKLSQKNIITNEKEQIFYDYIIDKNKVTLIILD